MKYSLENCVDGIFGHNFMFSAREKYISHPSSTAISTLMSVPKISCPIQVYSNLCLSALHKSWMVCIRTCARAHPFSVSQEPIDH